MEQISTADRRGTWLAGLRPPSLTAVHRGQSYAP
ncbi:hypothetical protein AMIS_74480 [Actinoplanes missouriensis 431]|uniref:Uncharacterized protein n=1 Tax=Actinoplanes missouriensis (strain ATCC 14538 / DSM 43046 / CBS 188.64 / JCM 3121 / NBRC 102363 / NCIMB 12654 / NRRL B-3342 / UNCC 431) TaxID=512565 RepID=I0HI31_ACTM4|nr:hypothetical protein AMIS_74480 [Actinoplanes missouriensis 431]